VKLDCPSGPRERSGPEGGPRSGWTRSGWTRSGWTRSGWTRSLADRGSVQTVGNLRPDKRIGAPKKGRTGHRCLASTTSAGSCCLIQSCYPTTIKVRDSPSERETFSSGPPSASPGRCPAGRSVTPQERPKGEGAVGVLDGGPEDSSHSRVGGGPVSATNQATREQRSRVTGR